MFIKNAAHTQCGAIYVESDINSTIVADNFSRLVFLNNSAFQCGALSVIPSSFTVKVRYYSSVRFINNTAHDVARWSSVSHTTMIQQQPSPHATVQQKQTRLGSYRLT